MKHALTVLCILAIILTGGIGISVTASGINPIVSDDVLKELKHLIAVDQVSEVLLHDIHINQYCSLYNH